jgi:hypothetical protein
MDGLSKKSSQNQRLNYILRDIEFYKKDYFSLSLMIR